MYRSGSGERGREEICRGTAAKKAVRDKKGGEGRKNLTLGKLRVGLSDGGETWIGFP